MDEKDRSDLRRRLCERRADLESVEATGAQAARPVELDQSRVGRLSRMDAMQAQAMAKATDRRRQLDMRRIDAALERIENDEYGDCLRCGEPIALARLAVDPATTLCLDCAQSRESGG